MKQFTSFVELEAGYSMEFFAGVPFDEEGNSFEVFWTILFDENDSKESVDHFVE